jgi:hypothetical protein
MLSMFHVHDADLQMFRLIQNKVLVIARVEHVISIKSTSMYMIGMSCSIRTLECT